MRDSCTYSHRILYQVSHIYYDQKHLSLSLDPSIRVCFFPQLLWLCPIHKFLFLFFMSKKKKKSTSKAVQHIWFFVFISSFVLMVFYQKKEKKSFVLIVEQTQQTSKPTTIVVQQHSTIFHLPSYKSLRPEIYWTNFRQKKEGGPNWFGSFVPSI